MRGPFERFVSHSPAVLNHQAKASGASQPIDGRRPENSAERLGNLRELRIELPGDGRAGKRRGFSISEPVENYKNGGGVRDVRAGDHGEPADDQRVGNPRGFADDFIRRRGDRLGAVDRGGVRKLDIRNEVAFVLLWDESHRRLQKTKACQPEECEVKDHDEGRHPRQPGHGIAVAVGDFVENGVESAEQPAEHSIEQAREGVLFCSRRLEQERGEGGAEGHGIERGDDCRDGDGQRELAVKFSGNSRDECRRNKDGRQHKRHGDHGPEDFGHRLLRGLNRSHPQVEVALHIFHDHDRVIHDDADREHDAEEGDVIERKPEGRHGGKRSNQGDRHRDQRDDRRPPGLQEEQDDQDHKRDGLEESVHDRVDGFLDEAGRVVVNPVVHAVRETGFQFLHEFPDAFCGLKRFASGLLVDRESDGRPPVQRAVDVVGLCAEFRAADIPEADDLAARALLNHNLVKLLRACKPALGIHRVLESGAVGNRRGADRSCRDLHVLLADGRDDILRREAARGKLLRIEPDPHAVFVAENADVADAVYAGKGILELQDRVVAEIERIEAVVGRDEVDDHHHRSRLLFDSDAVPADILREEGEGEVHTVLGENLCGIEVRAELEGDREDVGAVAVGLRRHVEHVLDAVDLLLDRGADRLRDRRGIGTRIACGHLHCRRRDLRILGDRQHHQRHRSDDRDDDRQHRSKDRAVDEEMADVHGVVPVVVAGTAAGSPLPLQGFVVTFSPTRAFMRPSTITLSPAFRSLPVTARQPSS